MENTKYIIKSVKLSEVVLPKLTEQKTKEYNFILNGQNHKFVKFLIDLYKKSDTHRSMIVTKANMTSGHNILISDNIDEKNKQELEDWFQNVNDGGDTLHDVISNLALDYWIFGYCFLQVIYNKLGEVHSIEHVDASSMAIGKSKQGKITTYFFSNDWSSWSKEENKPIALPAFDPENISAGKPQIIMIRKKEPGLVYYSNPPYAETTQVYALQEYDLSKYLLNTTNNGFSPSAVVVHFEPGLTDEQMDSIADSFDGLYSGTNQKKIVHVFPQDKELKPEVIPFQSNDDYSKYLEVQKTAQNMIAVGHMIVNKSLACLPNNDGGAFGDRLSIQDSFEILLKNNIRPVQQLIEKAINKVINHKVKGAKITIQTSSPLQFKAFSENILSQVMTRQEIRSELSLAPLKEGELTNLDEVRNTNPDLNNGQALYPNSILEQDAANKPNTNSNNIISDGIQ